jgi:hypothetical protein
MKRLFFLLPFLFVLGCSLPQPRDIVPPVVALIYPYDGAVLTSNVELNIQASDDDQVSKVWFYVDGVKKDEMTSAPYTATLNISGLTKKVNHVLQAAAQDNKGNVNFSPYVNFIVADSPDIIPPQVAIMNPQGGQVVEGTVNVTVHATDDRSVQKVALFIDGDSVQTDASYPYIFNWNTTGYSDSTSHALFAKAFDSGNNATVSAVVTVTVYPRTGAADNVAPSVFVLYPITGTIIHGTVQVSVDMQDNVGVANAEFYVDGALTKSQDNPAAPWIFNWDTSSKADSLSHSLNVKAFDAAGNVGTSGLLIVTIQ